MFIGPCIIVIAEDILAISFNFNNRKL